VKGRVLALGLLLAVFAAFLARGAGPGPAPPSPRGSVPGASLRSTEAPAEVTSPLPARDPFRYLDADAASRAKALPPAPEPKALASDAPPPLRLLGFVRRGDDLLAALSLFGAVVTAGAGEWVEGYAVLAVDEDAGVRLRAPDGAELVLSRPGS
jgi:hypothetical protein